MSFYKYNGFLNVYKEAGWTSMDVCAKLKGILQVRRIGHAGTLDPMAEGVLPVAVGKATKDVDKVGHEIKEYRAGMLLGMRTDTEDITGRVISISEKAEDADRLPEEAAVKEAVMSFVGEYDQLTPMYSARKVNGKKLYEYARKGIEVERKRKHVEIFDIRIEEIKLPHVVFTVSCSQGTYIRTLCHDIGERLGCGACMESLVRNRVGRFDIDSAIRINEIEELVRDGALDGRLSVEAPTAVAIGKFDGTHIGHQALLKELKRLADRKKLRTCVIIFKFGRDTVLSDIDRKMKMYELGIDYCMEIEFTESIKNTTAEDFLKDILIDKFNMKAIVAGDDVSFGKGREGNAEFLKAHADEYGYELKLIKKVTIDLKSTDEDMGAKEKLIGESGGLNDFSPIAAENGTAELSGSTVISSTLLRRELTKGDMLHVTRLLGAHYSLSGLIIHGRHIGTERLETPTLNIDVPQELILPPNGVYAALVHIFDDKKGKIVRTKKGIANLGYAPTVTEDGCKNEMQLRLEAHVFGDIGDCYGKYAKIELCYFIRPEKRFADMKELKAQVTEHDIPEAERFFENAGLL